MAQPVLVRAYTINENRTRRSRPGSRVVRSLPPISSFAFADILRAADSPELQQAIDGIADICAKNRLSLADEYGSHLPPLGEITAAATPTRTRLHLRRGMRIALTSVPEASSGSSESSRKSSKRGGSIFSFRRRKDADTRPSHRMRIGSMGRTIPVGSTTALALDHATAGMDTTSASSETPRPSNQQRRSSDAQASLQRLLTNSSGRLRPG